MPIYETENITCVEPADYPASRVSWSSDNAQVRFIGDCPSARPSFGVKVVEEKFLKIYVTPVISEDGWYESLSVYGRPNQA